MANPFFSFKQFTVHHHRSAMKVTTDACLFGAWAAAQMQKEKKRFLHLLDIGAGTGLLSLMAAQKNNSEIDAVEIDSSAAQQARDNFAQSPWPQRLHLLEGDITQMALLKTYDSIICNPPFYEKELTSPSATRNIAHHSYHLKLEQLFEIIYKSLNENGIFFLLLPYKRKAEAEQLLQQQQLHVHTLVEVHPSVAHQPFRLLLKGSKKEPSQKEKERFYIKDEAGQYTPPFVQLLKDYYLYL